MPCVTPNASGPLALGYKLAATALAIERMSIRHSRGTDSVERLIYIIQRERWRTDADYRECDAGLQRH